MHTRSLTCEWRYSDYLDHDYSGHGNTTAVTGYKLSLSFTQNRQEILKKKWVSASVEHRANDRDSMCVLALTGPCVYRSCSDDLAHES